MKAAQVISSLLIISVSLPIWFYIMYQVLEAINATELIWFLYWVYLPVTLLTNFIINIAKEGEK